MQLVDPFTQTSSFWRELQAPQLHRWRYYTNAMPTLTLKRAKYKVVDNVKIRQLKEEGLSWTAITKSFPFTLFCTSSNNFLVQHRGEGGWLVPPDFAAALR